MEKMEIVPGIHIIPVSTGAFMGTYPPNVYLVVGEVAALIDTGYGNSAHVKARLDYLDGIGKPRVAYVILTHGHTDHLGGAEQIRKGTGAKILSHPLEEKVCNERLGSARVEGLVQEGDSLDLGGVKLEFIHTPGHSPGCICIYIRKGGILFSGDQILGVGSTAINPEGGDMAQYIRSLEKLLSYEIRVICPGHGPVVWDPVRKIGELIRHRLERERQILELLKNGKRTVEELFQEMYSELDSRLAEEARGQILSHLIKLEGEGKVSRPGGGRGYIAKV